MDIPAAVTAVTGSRFVRVLIVGAIGVVVQTIVFEILAVYLGIVTPSTAAVLGGEIAILVNFSLNERFSFRDRVGAADSLLSRLGRFHLTVAGSLFLQWLFIFMTEQTTTDLLILHIAYAGGIILGFVSNYILYHLFVWKRTDV